MNKYKRFCLLLCSVLVFCVGFLSIDNLTVHAYEEDDNFYPFDCQVDLHVYNLDGTSQIYRESGVIPSSDGKYYFKNPQLNDIGQMYIYPFGTTGTGSFTFPYNHEEFDYYLVGSLTALCLDDTLSTFMPTTLVPSYYDVSDGYSYPYYVYDYNIYNIDSMYYKGFGFYERVDFDSADNIGIRHITMLGDIHGTGKKPPNLVLELGIMAIEKGSSQEAVMTQILNQLEGMESSINDSISDSADKVADAVEDQYSMAEDEDFGVDEMQDQVENNLGVLNFGADTLSSFLDLFSAETVGDTTITFPGFSMTIDGIKYQIWNDIEFDLSFLEDNFSILVNSVRVILVLTVWLAVLGYLVKAKDLLINNRG